MHVIFVLLYSPQTVSLRLCLKVNFPIHIALRLVCYSVYPSFAVVSTVTLWRFLI